MTIIKPAEELGSVLVGRSLAGHMRRRVETAVATGDVVLDFSGVESMSPSFADELIAKLPKHLLDGGRVRVENLGDELRPLARFVTAGR